MSDEMPECCNHPDRAREPKIGHNLSGYGYYCRYCSGLQKQTNMVSADKYQALLAENKAMREVLEVAKFDLEIYYDREKKECEIANAGRAVKLEPIKPPSLRYINQALGGGDEDN